MGILIFSKPFIDSYKEDKGIAYLTVSHKSNRCGFINISKERVTFQFSCGWYYSGKGFTSHNDVDFLFENGHLTMVYKTTKRNIFKLKCEREIFDKILIFIGRNE